MNQDNQEGTICTLLFRRVGDSLLATPAIRAIKKHFPARKLLVFAEPQVYRVFELIPWIDKIVDTGKSPSPFHLARLLRHNGQPAVTVDFLSDPRSTLACFFSHSKMRVGFAQPMRSLLYHKRVSLQDPLNPIYSAAHKLKLALALGAESDSLETDFYLKPPDLEFAREWQKRANITQSQHIIAIFPYSRREYKRWPADHYVELCRKLAASPNIIPLLISGPGEANYCRAISDSAGLNRRHTLVFHDLGEMAAVLRISNLYVGNDGGPKHLAVAVKTPTVTIFQNDPPEYWTPPNNAQHIALSSDAASMSGALSVDSVYDTVASVLDAE
jgi:ADP-heptose:LPS heptosyltransferase